jgi:hypothetical protein
MNPISTSRLKSTDTGSAIILTAATGAAVAAGQTSGVKDIYSLRNPLQVPILVDSIDFDTDGTTDAGPANALGQIITTPFNGGDLRVMLRLGQDQITATYVPIWVLGKARNLSVSGVNGLSGGVNGAASIATPQQNSGIYGTTLSSPLIVHPGEYIEPVFYNAGQLNPGGSITARITVRGRAMNPGSKRQSLPWISYFAGSVQNVGTNYTEETRESDLANPFNTPLYVDRMVGVIGSFYNSSDYGPYRDDVSVDAGLNYCLVRMADESGRPMVRDLTPFGHLFQMQTYSWEFKSIMPVNSFYKAYLTENYASITGFSGNPTLQVYMALNGRRLVTS